MLLINLFILTIYCITIINGQETAKEEECVCVPYYQCEDGRVLVTGEGLLDPRLKTCTGIEVCCLLPDDGETPRTPIVIPPTPTPTQKPVTPDPGSPDGGENPVGVGPSLPKVAAGEGCGLRRFRNDGNTAENALRITGLLGYPEETFYGEAPWMVRLLRVENGQINDTYLMCGGSLITPTVVLTAAHCIHKLTAAEILARVGDWNINANYEPIQPQDRKVVRTIIHPEFNPRNLANDIALIGLESPVKLSKVVDTLCTPDPEKPVNGSACIAVGWGKNDLTVPFLGRYGTYQDILRKVHLPLLEKDECQKKLRKTKLGKYFKLLPGFTCAGGIQDSDTCEGDGGGPLYCPLLSDPNRYAQVGITAWGIDCGKGNPAVFAQVSHYMPWIKEQIS